MLKKAIRLVVVAVLLGLAILTAPFVSNAKADCVTTQQSSVCWD